jgi:hypothetical protein
MASSNQVVGNPTPRIEGELKVSGQAKYAVDVTLPGMLWGKLLPITGSAAGLMSTPATSMTPVDGANGEFGFSVASAGDVNGDGYSEVIVGSELYDNGQADEGRASVYYGNGGAGLSLRPQQRRSDDARPIAHVGASDGPNSFRLAALGRSTFGRARLKLEQEVKPIRSLFTGTGTQIATAWTDSGTAGAALDELASGLTASTPYHWRVRVRYQLAANPFQQTSRWLTVPWKGWQEWMLRTAPQPVVAAGSVPASGAPLLVGKGILGQITLTWSASCLGTDTDYEIYEGTIGGTFTSHTSRFCSTSGATTKTLLPLPMNAYYLVVPRNSTREGSYGTKSGGVERPQGVLACLSQLIGSCP